MSECQPDIRVFEHSLDPIRKWSNDRGGKHSQLISMLSGAKNMYKAWADPES